MVVVGFGLAGMLLRLIDTLKADSANQQRQIAQLTQQVTELLQLNQALSWPLNRESQRGQADGQHDQDILDDYERTCQQQQDQIELLTEQLRAVRRVHLN
jgi:hypothetical protein